MNKETLIKGLEWCIRAEKQCVFDLVDCPFVDECRKKGSISLKEALLEYLQNTAAKPVMVCLTQHGAVYKCPKCETPLVGKANYCFICGANIDWSQDENKTN